MFRATPVSYQEILRRFATTLTAEETSIFQKANEVFDTDGNVFLAVTHCAYNINHKRRQKTHPEATGLNREGRAVRTMTSQTWHPRLR